MPKYLLVCRHCRGQGKIVAPPYLSDLITYLKSKKQAVTAEIYRDLKKNEPRLVLSTLSNRLSRLVDLGLLKRVQESAPTGGIQYRWFFLGEGK